MKIASLESQTPAAAAVGDRKAAATGSATPIVIEPSAKVALSPAVAQAGQAEAVFDADKVRRIAEAIRDGNFTVDAEAIADKLIGNAQELLGNVQKR